MGIHDSRHIEQFQFGLEHKAGGVYALLERRIREIMRPVQGSQAIVPVYIAVVHSQSHKIGRILCKKHVGPDFVCPGGFPQPGQIGVRKSVGQRKILIIHERLVQQVQEGSPCTEENRRPGAGRNSQRTLGGQQTHGEVSLEPVHQGIPQFQVDSSADARFRPGRGTVVHARIVG